MADVRPIDANALIKMMVAENNRHPGASWEISDIERYVTKLLPTINPDDLRPHGRWINAYVEGVHYYRCSECGEYIEAVWTANFIFKNCPNCGACMNLSDTNVGDMDGKENEDDRHRSDRYRRGGYPDSGNHLLSGGSRRGREDGQEMSELKPYPFCESDAVVHVENGVRVICKKCGASTKTLVDTYTQGRPTGGAIKTVVNAWNRRPNRDE